MPRLKAAFAVILFVVSLTVAGCASDEQYVGGKVNVVTSIYPLYDFATQIGGEHAHVVNLVPAGVEPHEWQPKSRDAQRMVNADLFIYNGAGFEGWVRDFLDSLKPGEKPVIVEASDGIELIRGESATEHHSDEEDGHEGHGTEYDPHVWLSPLQAIRMAENVKDGFVRADPDHKADYEANFRALSDRLQALHQKYEQSLAGARGKEIVVSHQSFGYLCRDYGLKQIAIMGLSPDSEPTAQDLKRVRQLVRERGIKVIFFEKLLSGKLVKTIAEDAGAETLVLDPLEGLTPEEEKAGADYVSIMESNLQNLLKALQ